MGWRSQQGRFTGGKGLLPNLGLLAHLMGKREGWSSIGSPLETQWSESRCKSHTCYCALREIFHFDGTANMNRFCFTNPWPIYHCSGGVFSSIVVHWNGLQNEGHHSARQLCVCITASNMWMCPELQDFNLRTLQMRGISQVGFLKVTTMNNA